MKQFKKFYKIFVLMLVFTMVSPTLLPASSVAIAQAATVKLSKKDITLEIGKTKSLTVIGTTKNVTWTTSKKSVATVSKSGKVTAKKAGTATITAIVNKKKYTCKVTVKEAVVVNPFIADAPYDAQELTSLAFNYVIPKDWTSSVLAEQGNNIMIAFYPASADTTKGSSNVTLTIQETGNAKPDYSVSKEYLEGICTQELITSQLTQAGMVATLSDYKISDYDSINGTAFKVKYKATSTTGSMTQVIYDIYFDNYLVQVTVTDIGDGITPDVSTVGEYLLNSIQVTK